MTRNFEEEAFLPFAGGSENTEKKIPCGRAISGCLGVPVCQSGRRLSGSTGKSVTVSVRVTDRHRTDRGDGRTRRLSPHDQAAAIGLGQRCITVGVLSSSTTQHVARRRHRRAESRVARPGPPTLTESHAADESDRDRRRLQLEFHVMMCARDYAVRA